MLNDGQQRKALVLSLLMVMLAQTAYIESYRGWTLAEGTSPSHLNAACTSTSRPSGSPIFVDAVNGSDDWNGTTACPKATLADALNDAIADDEIVLASGRYHENVTVNNLDNLLIRAASGARVVFDGTQSIADDLNVSWSLSGSDGIQETTLPVDGWQLFLSYDEQVPARWPNAQFSDETVFNRSYWAEGTLTGSNNAYTQGWLTDAGPEAGVHTGLNETVNATGLDPVGAIAVMNLGSFRSNSRIITDWNPSNGTFAYDGTGVGWKNKHHAYFLEGKRDLIDQDGEWWFNNTNNRLHYKTPSGQDANDLDLRVKVQPFAISVENSDGVTVQGIDFFGTTVNFNECDGCSFTNATLEYPSTSKRGLGIAGESEDDRWMTRFYRSTNSFVDNISITNTDGGAIEFQGSAGQSHNNTVNNSYFHAVDWSAADQKGLMTTVYEGGRDMHFTNNTVHLTGASSVLSIGDAPKVFYNEVWDVGHLQTDGAVVQIMQGEAPGAEVAYNWIHDVIKYGVRFDAPIGQPGQGRNGTMHHNVIWNAAGGLMVKGDHHDIHNNTVFNSSASKNDIIALTDGGINNKNSTLHRNAVDSMADHRSDDVHDNPLPNGTHWSNWNGYLQGYDGMFEARNQLSCAIYDNGSLYCWGRNDHGQLGLGYTSGREEAPQYVDLGTGRSITSLGIDDSGAEGWAPNSHSCAVLDNGELVCWGANDNGQLGLGNTTSGGVWEPTTVNVGTGLTTLSVAVGNGATCALLSDHSVKCWGKNNHGQLGLGNTSSNDVLTPHAVTFSGSSSPISLHAGRNEFCAQLDNGSAACWGGNDFGQFGLGNSTAQNTPAPLSIPTGRTITSMSVSKEFMCFSLDNGSVLCAGKNNVFQLGTGTTSTQETTWQYVADLGTGVHSVELAAQMGCAHLVNGSMVCWGKDEWGLFGNDVASAYGTPRIGQTASEYVNVGAGRTAASISLNFRHACAVLDNVDLTCWGRNHRAQLGLGNTTQQYQPVVVNNVSKLRQLAVHEMLVDPANDDFRPTWGSPLHQLSAGAYDAGDADPWTAGVSWTYSPMGDPISGCMDSRALNHDATAVFADRSCRYTALSSSTTSFELTVGDEFTHQLNFTNPFVANISGVCANGCSSNNVGEFSDIALDSNGARHMCYSIGSYVFNLGYATDKSGQWSSGVVVTSNQVGHSCQIVLDSNDRIHIVTFDDTNDRLLYSTKTLAGAHLYTGHWSTSTLTDVDGSHQVFSLAVDSSDTLHLSYYEGSGDLKYRTKTSSGSWSSASVVDSTNDVGQYSSIALDGDDAPHIVYHDATNNNLRYAHKQGTSWTTSTIDSQTGAGVGTAVAVDAHGKVHVAYETDASEMAYTTDFSGSWVKTVLDTNNHSNAVSIGLDDDGNPHVVFLDEVDDDLFYMTNALGSWQRALVTASADSGGTNHVMDANGDLHISYPLGNQAGYAAQRSVGNYQTFEVQPDLPEGLSIGQSNATIHGAPVSPQDTTTYTVWVNTSSSSASTSIDLTVLAGLLPDVPYQKLQRNTALSTVSFNWTVWSSNVINSTDSVYTNGQSGDYTSIAVDSDDHVHIVFYRNDNTNLMYAHNTSGTWSVSSIDSSNNVGKYCAIAIDSNDGLHVSYQYNTGNSLKYAYKSSGASSWSKSTVDNTGGKYTAIAVDSNDKPYIAYRDSGGNLAIANKSGSNWAFDTFDFFFVSEDIEDTSIEFDADDKMHLAVYDKTDEDLYYVTNHNGYWSYVNLEDIGAGGNMAVDIAIDPTSDLPGISYFDADNTDLKFTKKTSQTLNQWTTTTVDSSNVGRDNSLAFDGAGNAHISAERNGVDDLIYATDSSGSWVSSNVDATNGVGLHSSIVLDSNDDVHIAYRYNTGYDLKYATVQGYKTEATSRTGVQSATCSVSPSLPSGLSLTQGSCSISGTPSSHGSNITYTVTATSSTGVSKTGEVTIWVTPLAPSIAYTGSPFTFTVGTAISSITPSNTGDSAFWSVSPALPSGLTLGSSGVISGTPSTASTTATYTVTASNPGGQSTATLSFTVNAQPPSGLTYATENMSLTRGAAMSANNPSVGGGPVTSWEISPNLPSGLSLSGSTGAITGTPTALQATQPYTVWANNSGGSTSASVNITVNDVAPSGLSFSPENMSLTKGVTMTSNTPSVSGGTITSWTFSPALPAGMTYSATTGAITGTPSVLQTSAVTYTVWANNSGGSATANINITIIDVPPNTMVYSVENMTLEKGTAMSANTVSIGGGAATTWAISPTLPSGLSLGAANGAISGTPTVLQTSAVTYTIWANNSGGSTSAQVNITINDRLASVSYPSTIDVSNDRTMTTVSPTVTGGAVTSWVIVPSLPSGLNFGSTNGSVWGTPTGLLEDATYTVYANNSGGSTSIAFTLGLNWTLTPSTEGAFITRNMSLSPDITWTINPSGAVSGATCAISPSLPTGLGLTAGTCAITGTPTVTATNATYTVWANISGTSYSGQVWLEVGLNAPNPSYSHASYTYTRGSTISTVLVSNTGGEVTSWAINATLPSGLFFGTSNGSIWGTPNTVTSSTSYTVYANNSAGSSSTTITLTVNDPAPNFSYTNDGSTHYVLLYLNQTMNAVTPITFSGGGLPTSCSSSPSLPSGMTLSSSCVISGTPNVTASFALYTITGTNTGGSDSDSIYISVLAAGGSLTVSPTNREGAVNTTLTNITMSYAHQISNYGWTSGVSNTTTTLTNGLIFGSGQHWLGVDSGEQGEMAVVFAHNDSGASTHSLALMYRWNGAWTETILDNGTDTGQHPSVAIDRQGALHIAYIDDHNDKLRYATNASGSWVFLTLGVSSYDNDDGRGTAIVVHPITDAVHIVTTIYENSSRDLQYHTNEGGSWVNETITNTSKDEGHDPSMVMDGDGNLYVAHYCDNGCSDLRMSSRINGVWQNETVAGVASMHGMSSNYNIGTTPEMAIDSQGTLHIVSQRLNSKNIYLHSGTPGNWYENRNLTGTGAHWPAVAVDSNDAVHITYHVGSNKDMMYLTNASGSWTSPASIEGYGGWGSVMHIDANDDVFIPNNAPALNRLQITTVKGSGQGLTVRPIYDISPMLPDGLNMNWRTGTISGTPTETHTNTTHTVTVTALGTTTTATFTLLVTGVPGDVSYANITGTKGTPIVAVSPSFSNGSTSGSVSSWAINTTLPGGLNFDTSTGVISGTPTVVVVGAVFTVWANNSVGSKSTTVNITVNDVPVSSFTYTAENSTLTLYHTMTTITATTTGGTPTSWGIHPALPSGLSFNTTTGAVSGTPEVLQTTTVTYTVWANNSGGSFSDQINITINDNGPVPLNYFGGNITLDHNQTTTSIGDFELRPDLMAAGEDHSCAIEDDGTVRCWGEGANGRLGYGGSANKHSPTGTSSLGTGRTAVDITAGGDHTCVVLDDGSVACWGGNAFGQLGDGTTTSRTTPTQTLSLGRPAVAVEAGMFFTCALLDNGSVSCWGKNNNGQLGRGFKNSTSDLSQRTPGLTLPMPGDRPVVAMDISHYMVCGVLDNGSIACWSQYGGGQTPSLRTFFSDANPAKDVATGRYSACALMENGSLTCWGTGFLGTGGSGQNANPGVIWPNLGSGRTAVHVELGRKHNCALLDNDAVKCWGDDSYGQMANGASSSNENTPTSVSFASEVVAQDIIAGHWHTCIAAQTNELYCWGDGVYGKLGDGSSAQNNYAGSAAKVNHFSGSNPVRAHGEITSWAVHPALPTGLALGSTNGTLWGTPTTSVSQTNFTVYANNSGGSSEAYLTITVVEELANIAYNPSSVTVVRGYTMANVSANNTGGAVVSWAISPALPSGLSFDNGTVHGRPLSNMSATTYTVHANNSGGSATATLTLTINEATPNIDYSPDNYTLTNGTSVEIKPFLLSNPPSGSGTLLTGTSVRAQGCMQLIGDLIIFIARDELSGVPYTTTGYELWAFNHTQNLSASNPYLIKDIYSGYGSSMPSANQGTTCSQYMMVHNNTLFFAADDNSGKGVELWRTQGTNASTVLVKDTYPGSQSGTPKNFFVLDDTLYFSGRTSSASNAIWKTNGTASGTVLISSTCGTNPNCHFAEMTEYNGSIYGQGYDWSGGRELFVMNGTTWQMLVDLSPGSNFGVPKMTNPSHLTVFDGWLYFDTSLGKIYRTNGTSAGTTQFTTGSTKGYTPMQVFKDELYFVGQGVGATSYELWKTDGTNITLVKDINPQSTGANSGFCTGTSYSGCSTEFQVFGDHMLFVANNGSTGRELWITDGTTAGTRLLKDINPAASTSYPPKEFFVMDDVVYFRADDGTNGYELWRTDGTETGTVLVNDVRPGSDSSTPYGFTRVGDDLFFVSVSSYNMGGFYQVKNASNGIIGAPSSWSISPSLPAGLNFGTSNGTIWGTPTALSTTTWYNITATNANGSSTTSINITINDQLPTLSYSPSNLTLTKGQSSSDLPLNATLTGSGEITSWAINATLPSGLNFGTSNGTIWGIPTVLQTTAVNYTIWANNSGGSTSATVTITVIDEAPSISYAYDDIVATLNVSISPHSGPTNTGGAVTSWEISPSPGPAFHFNTLNGVISGTPGMLLPTTQYTVYANNSGGSSIAYVNVTINPDAPNISYSPNELNLTRATTSSDLPLSPTNTGGNMQTASFCSSTNSPPLFVVSDHEGTRHVLCNKDLYSTYLNGTQTVSTNQVSGNPFALEIDEDGHLHIGHWTYTYPYTYIHHATNKHGSWQSSDVYNFSGGFDGDDFKMAVGSDDSLHFTYTTAGSGGNSNDLRYLTNQSGSWSSASVASASGGYRTESPQIALNSEDVPHIIYNTYSWGVNVVKYDNNTFTNLFSRSSGYKLGDITIDSNDHVHVTYSKYQGLFYSTNASGSWQSSTIASLGGTVLDTRIALDSNDHPHVMSASMTGQYNNYRHVSHYNHNGTSWNGGIITPAMSSISQPRPDIFIDDNDVISTVYHDQSNGNLFTGTGLTIYGYSISPALPSGLRFSQSTGTISGTANVQMNRTMYTITANNSGGSSTAYINITVDARAPSFTYNPENLTLTNNTVSSDLPLVPATHYSADVPTDWVLMGTLPAGLNFGTNNGTIWGTATELWATTNYTVYGNNTGGSFNVSINITVNDEVPTVSYTPSTLVLTLGQQSSDLPLNATLTGSGDITSWEINATLPTGLNFGTSNGTVWGIPTVLQTTPTTYTIWANNTGGSTSATVTITINDEAPGPFQYNPENNTWTNNTEVHLAPQFINGTTGNGSTWQVADIYTAGTAGSSPRSFTLVGGVLYFKAGTADGNELWAHDPSNRSTWQVADINSGSGDGMTTGEFMLIGDTLYFSADDGIAGKELWAHDTSNHSTWQVADINSGAGDSNALGGSLLRILDGGTLYFVADDGSTGHELWAHDTSNHSTWQVADINSGSGDSNPGGRMHYLVGDTLYFEANDGSTGYELWAHDTSNHSTWQVFDFYIGGSNGNIHSGTPGWTLDVLVGDTLYFGAQDGSTTAGGFTQTLWAHDTSNHSTWRINDGSGNGFGVSLFMCVLVGDTLYWSYLNQIWAHDTSNQSTWLTDSSTSFYSPGMYMELLVDDTIYFSARDGNDNNELWAYDTSNGTTWQVAEIRSGSSGSNPGDNMQLLVGDTIYFDASDGGSIGRQLWAHDTSNRSTWRVTDNSSGSHPGFAWVSSGIFVDDTIYFSFRDGSGFGSTGYELWAHRPSTIDYNTNTGGAVTSWAINASLPSGVSFGTNNGTVYGTPTELWPQTSYMVWANNSGGSSVAYLNITVVDQLPTSLTYTSANVTLVRGEVSTDLPLSPSLTGPGEITSWAINASLPTGLSFGINNGTIWGVPLVNMTTTTYTVWANNTGGSVSTILNITVLEPIVVLDYNPENLTLIRGVQMAPLFPSVSGGNVSDWSISPDLPAGLNFSDGVISGTPTVNMTLSTYTVWANTSGGATSHALNITILEPSGDLSYSPQNITLIRGVAMANLHPTYSGGVVENWSIHPALPAGLNFSNGVLSGTPSVNMTTTMFTVYANNSGGSAATTINITILEPAVDLSYSPDNLTLMRGTTMGPLLPTVSGGNVSEWGIEPALPSGLNFADGVFSGTPAVNMTHTQFTVYANTSGGSAMAWVNITILEPAVDLSYNPYNITLIRNVSMTPLSPTVSGGDVEVWTIEPALPLGLNFSNGAISGTPQVNMTTTMFTVWANTTGGAASTTVNITVLEPTVEFLYAPNSVVMTRNETVDAIGPVFGNDASAEAWGISPALPAGLDFSNGVITGTPEVNMTATVFTIYANNSGGSAVAYLTITILEPLATVVYLPENITLTRGEDNASILPFLGGGTVETWSITPALPDGLVFDNGSITGVPLVNSTNITYTVSATNTGGTAFSFLNITVVEPIAVLSLNHSFVLTRGETYLNATVNNTGGQVASWSIEPTLPAGVDLWNGLLYGTSTVNLTQTTFTVWANNSGGSTNLTFTLEVIEPVAVVDYADGDVVLVNGVSRGLIVPVLAGGVPENWSIEPALPSGLSFVNGYIVGVATMNLTATTYTVWANNSGGVALATFNLTVNQPTFYARYPVTRVVLDVNETMPTLSPIYYFGDNQNPTWAIAPDLPEGLVFENGKVSGTALEVSNETNYTITVFGEMVPVELYVVIEVREVVINITVESVRNSTQIERFILPELEEVDDSFDMYWICFPLLLFIVFLVVAAINNFLALTSKEEDEDENDDSDDEAVDGD